MNELQNQHIETVERKKRRWPWILLPGLLLLLAMLRISLTTNFVRTIVKNQIVAMANDQLTVALKIDQLKGDLWKEVVLEGITLTGKSSDTDTLASIDSLKISYRLTSYFGDEFEIPEVSIYRPYLKFEQRDSVVNVAGWVKEAPPAVDEKPAEPFQLRIDRLAISAGKVDAHIETLPGDSLIEVQNLTLESSFALLSDGYEAAIRDFSFSILQTRLEEPVTVQTSLNAQKQQISLEKLVIATGNSMLQSEGMVNAGDSTADISFRALPLAWRDIAAYVDESPVHENLELGLTISGKADRLTAGLQAQSTGIQDLEAEVSFSWRDRFEIKNASLTAARLDLPQFLGDSTLPAVQQLRLQAEGNIPLDDYQAGSLSGDLFFGKTEVMNYRLDSTRVNYTLERGNLKADAAARRGRQTMQADLNIQQLWGEGESPEIRLTATARQIDPAYWLQDESYKGDLNFTANVKGSGYQPGQTPWHYRLDFGEGAVAGQHFSRLSLRGNISGREITNETNLRLEDSELAFTARVLNYKDVPEFEYLLEADHLDLSEARGMEAFKTDLGFVVEGGGSGLSIEDLRLNSTIRLDSSVVNGERISRLLAEISVEDTIATVRSAELQSTIAEGSFDASFHLQHWYDSGNELKLNLLLKDLQSLAPLAGVESLKAEGRITGRLVPIYDSRLKFSGRLDLKEIAYNDQLTATAIDGDVEVFVVEEPEYVLSLNLQSPTFSAVQLRDLLLESRGKLASGMVEGDFKLNFKGPNESEIVHSGFYHYGSDSTVVTTQQFELITELRALLLEEPFRITLKDQLLQMEPMRLSSGDGAILELAVPHIDSLRQEGYLLGENLDLSAIQSAILSESYFEGMLSGNLSVANTDSSFSTQGKLELYDLNYRGTTLETLNLELDINNEKLFGNLLATDGGKELIAGYLNLPFRLGDPEDFDESFFERPVEGFFNLKPVALNRFDSLLSTMGIRETEGIIQLHAELEGKAGEPRLTSSMKLDSAMISGVNIDSLTTELNYVHEQSMVTLNTTVNSLKQRAAEINALAPFYLDLRNGSVSWPGEQDSVSVDINTNNFNLAAFNDFVDRSQLRNIRGTLDGRLFMEGKLSELDTRGEMKLKEASVRIVPSGITVDGIHADFIFSPDLFTVKQFRARSGGGSLNLNGSVGFEDLVPGAMDIQLNAKNFSIANTSQLNAAIDLDAGLGGTFKSPEISGSLSVLNGFVQLDNFGEKSVESVQLDEAAEPPSSVAVYDSLKLDVDVSFNRRFFIRNQRYLEMEVELDGAVDMLKEPAEDLQMFGTLETVNGYARPLGKRFELEEGVVTFTGNPENPDLRIRTLFEPPQPEEEIMIWYIIEGNVESPQFKYESSPPMELEDILCYTLFGQPCYALESWKRAVASSGSNATATDLALDIFMDRIESLATQRLGIDVVKIDNTHSGGETGTSITTGWYVNPKVFFAVQNVITGSSPETSFLLEYLLKENLKLIILQGNEARQGVDLRWNYDY